MALRCLARELRRSGEMTASRARLNIAHVFYGATTTCASKCLIEALKQAMKGEACTPCGRVCKPRSEAPQTGPGDTRLKPDFRIGRIVLIGLVSLAILGVVGFLGARAWYAPQLPSVESLHEIKLGVPLRVYTRDGKLIGEFGAERREPLRYEQLPKPLVQAFLAAEDDRFFEHSGVDMAGLARAVVVLATTGEKRQGGSTITMQLARNVYLTNERSFSRKFKEIFLAQKIERELSK
ncbi:MAG TPA: transglycosylase domain-containing protein, partial [Nevskia sp.]|nr:transglycosylase domain-containing protein [Nevskia sp.]